MRVYKENNVNPAGCHRFLSAAHPFIPVLRNYRALTYMLNKSKEVVETLSAYVSQHVEKMSYHVQIEI